MILAIDTSTDKNGIALYSPNKIEKEIFWQREKEPEQLLPKIDKLLKKNKATLKDLKAIAVFRGPGSFTGLRVGISVANTFAWVLNIPVIGFGGTKYQNKPLKMAKDALSKILAHRSLGEGGKKAKVGNFVKPVYK